MVTKKEKSPATKAREKRRIDFGKRLRTLRENIGLTGVELAKLIPALGQDRHHFISQVEKGQVRVPSEQTIEWADALGYKRSDFVKNCLYFYEREMFMSLYYGNHKDMFYSLPNNEKPFPIYYLDEDNTADVLDIGDIKPKGSLLVPEESKLEAYEIISDVYWAWLYSRKMYAINGNGKGTMSLTGRLELLNQNKKGMKRLEEIIGRKLTKISRPEKNLGVPITLMHLTEDEWTKVYDAYIDKDNGFESGIFVDDEMLLERINGALKDFGRKQAKEILPETFQHVYRTIKIPRRIDSHWDKPVYASRGYIGAIEIDEIHIEAPLHTLMTLKENPRSIENNIVLIHTYWKHFDPTRMSGKLIEIPQKVNNPTELMGLLIERNQGKVGKVEMEIEDGKSVARFISKDKEFIDEIRADASGLLETIEKAADEDRDIFKAGKDYLNKIQSSKGKVLKVTEGSFPVVAKSVRKKIKSFSIRKEKKIK